MKVNELKALYQKKSIIIPQPQNPPIHIKTHIQPVSQPIVTPKPPAQIAITHETPIITQQTFVNAGSMRKNTHFLDELNKKLEKKPTRQSHLQQNFQYYSRGQPESNIQTTHKQEQKTPNQHQLEIPMQMIRPKSKTFDVSPQQQLDFSTIIGNNQEGLIKSRIRARLAVDQRHPLTKQDKILFTQLDSQIRETIEAQKIQQENRQKNEKDSNVNTINVSRQDIAKSIIESTRIEEKINRIDFFLACIFGEKERQFVGQKSMQNIGTNIVDLFNQKIKTFKKHPINSEVISLTTAPISNITLPSQLPSIKPQQLLNNPVTQKPLQKTSEQQKKQISSLPIQDQSLRPNLSMTKQMLQQMNMKLKRRNNHQQPTNSSNPNILPIGLPQSNERSVSPMPKKKRVFQKFDDV